MAIHEVDFTDYINASDTVTGNVQSNISFQDGLSVSDTILGGVQSTITYQDGFNLSDTPSLSKLITIAFEDNFNLGETRKANADYLIQMVDQVNFNGFLATYKEENGELVINDAYDCWVVNYESNAFSRFTNYNFNSMCNLNGKYYAANELGIFELGGDTDNGADIKSKILTGELDISGVGAMSYLRDILLIQKSDGTIRLNIKASDGATENYRLLDSSDELTQSKIHLSQGRKAIFWQFELTNDEQTNFEIEEMKLYRVVTGRLT